LNEIVQLLFDDFMILYSYCRPTVL